MRGYAVTWCCIVTLAACAFLLAPSASAKVPPHSAQLLNEFLDQLNAPSERDDLEIAGDLVRKLLGSRRLYNGKKISDRFCAMDANERCNWPDYVKLILTIIVPMIVLAALCLICCPFLLCLRACGCLGGNKPRPGLCCGSGDEDKRYMWNTILSVKGVAVVFAVAVLICFAFAYDGNRTITKGISTVGNAIVGAVQTVRDRIAFSARVMNQYSFTRTTAAPALQRAVTSADDLIKTLSEARRDVNKYEKLRQVFVNLSLLIPFFALVTSVVLGMFNVRQFCVHILLAQFIMLLLVIIWVSTAIHSVIALVLHDGCKEIRLSLDGAGGSNIFDTLSDCSGPNGVSQGFVDLLNTANDGVTAAENAACGRFSSLCTAGSQPRLTLCPSGVVCNATTLPQWGAAVWDSANAVANGKTVSACYSECTVLTAEWTDSQLALNDSSAARDYLNSANDLAGLINCDFLLNLIRGLAFGVCSQLSGGLTRTARSSIAFASFLMFSIVVLWLGQKRFLPKAQSKDHGVFSDKDSYATQFGAVAPAKGPVPVQGPPDLDSPMPPPPAQPQYTTYDAPAPVITPMPMAGAGQYDKIDADFYGGGGGGAQPAVGGPAAGDVELMPIGPPPAFDDPETKAL